MLNAFRSMSIWIVVLVFFSLSARQVNSAEGMVYPLGAAVTADGTIFIADRNLPGIWMFSEGKWSIYFQGSKKFRTPGMASYCIYDSVKITWIW